LDIKRILDKARYGLEHEVIVMESKELILKTHHLTDWFLLLSDLDDRVLTLMMDYRGKNKEFDFAIIVYDYEHFSMNEQFSEAVIFHEITHIKCPVTQETMGSRNMEALLPIEATCDQAAKTAGYAEGMKMVLNAIGDMAEKTKNEFLTELTKHRLELL